MREIPSLRVLALRAVGPKNCDPEITFGGPRARRNAEVDDENDANGDANVNASAAAEQKSSSSSSSSPLKDKKRHREKERRRLSSLCLPLDEPTLTSRLLRSLRDLSGRPQRPYSGPGRPNANDVDIAHPWILAVYPPRESVNNAPLLTAPTTTEDNDNDATTTNEEREFLAIENSNHAVECMQQFIDALVESGRAGDTRMGAHFFREWVAAITGMDARAISSIAKMSSSSSERVPRKKKRQKSSSSSSSSSTPSTAIVVDESLPLGSLSLHNFAAGSTQTFRSMQKANVGCCLGTLDLSGVHGLTDSILSDVICNSGSFPRIRRLSVKNCRKLTGKGIASLVKLTKLAAFDVGGCFNIHPADVTSLVRNHPSTKKGRLVEIYASGLGWTDVALEEIVDATAGRLRGLGVGFSPYISGPGLILTLGKLASTLSRLAVPFCTGMDDAAAAALGRTLPNLAVLDIRGCNKVYSLSAMMEGRVGNSESNGASAGHLFVLGRYSGISNNSLEETMRLFDGLTCVLDGGGIGEGIRR
eukprot:CAMPEP_0183721930 /NCGR_PEP_ID=MMETSP0737-20130205/14041_1 /TAXON_ID=385413 /ORGANISM="Thalassiosira miniscula, Strain CCMP1093" /LENGTH=531 /DNA_ID=CAMNT_0025951999 /DNA_START=40 /DNA_END=1635 /DNA_ORIENTATION=-